MQNNIQPCGTESEKKDNLNPIHNVLYIDKQLLINIPSSTSVFDYVHGTIFDPCANYKKRQSLKLLYFRE